jgi:hypothetical protein
MKARSRLALYLVVGVALSFSAKSLAAGGSWVPGCERFAGEVLRKCITLRIAESIATKEALPVRSGATTEAAESFNGPTGEYLQLARKYGDNEKAKEISFRASEKYHACMQANTVGVDCEKIRLSATMKITEVYAPEVAIKELEHAYLQQQMPNLSVGEDGVARFAAGESLNAEPFGGEADSNCDPQRVATLIAEAKAQERIEARIQIISEHAAALVARAASIDMNGGGWESPEHREKAQKMIAEADANSDRIIQAIRDNPSTGRVGVEQNNENWEKVKLCMRSARDCN